MKPSKCCEPYCENCPYDDCMWSGAEADKVAERKRKRYHNNIEESRRKQREYRKSRNTYRDNDGLNANQRKMYDFIISYTKDNLYPPAITEIADAVGIATSSVQSNLIRIEKCGLISTGKGQRSIKLIGFELVRKD